MPNPAWLLMRVLRWACTATRGDIMLRVGVTQAAKTYLEKHYESFAGATMDELIRHGLKALAGSLADGELTGANTAIAVVGPNMPLALLEDDALEPYIAALKEEEGAMVVEAPPAAAADAEAPPAAPAAGEAGDAPPAAAPMDSDSD